MELWIRSQKNEKLRPLLLKVNEIEIGDYDDDMNCIVVNNLHCVGIYKSKERALEVLDEIEKRLKNNVYFKQSALELKNGFNKLYIPYEESSQVYQMPEE